MCGRFLELARVRSAIFDGRLLRKPLSPNGFVSRNPSLVLAFMSIGLITVILLFFTLVNTIMRSYMPNRFILFPGRQQRSNAPFLDKSGVPRPIFVIAGGAPRTGSTLIFNILRILMRIRDPNTVASSNWMLAKLVPENSSLEAYDRIALLRTMATSILVKVHTAKQYYNFAGPLHRHSFAEQVDLLVTGYRDLREETVSAFKMFAKNRTEWLEEHKWSEMCRALIRRRNSLITEAGRVVPVVDVKYEDWNGRGASAMLDLVRILAANMPWYYTEDDYARTLQEIAQLRVPAGGKVDSRVEWHVSNLMSPKHISKETLRDELVAKGLHAIYNEPVCKSWLADKGYT